MCWLINDPLQLRLTLYYGYYYHHYYHYYYYY